MNCPKCNLRLLISERQGIEIDYCPECRGVWLDRGELDKIIERANEHFPEQKKHFDHDDESPSYGKRMTGKHDQDYYRSHKKKSILGELFDF